MSVTEQAASAEKNQPLALRMAAIAFIAQNVTLACLFGSFSVLLGSVEKRLGVGREQSTLAVPILALVTAVLAPMVGTLAARVSLRLVMITGAAMSVAGFAVLALTSSYPLYLAAYALLLGPGMAIGVVTPPTLVTRWFVVHRGRALGIVSTPVIIALMPLAATWMVQSHGLSMTYVMLAALSALSLLACFFAVDRPLATAQASSASETPGAPGAHGPIAAGGLNLAKLLRSPRFWALSIAFSASTAGSLILTSHMAPIALGWGFSATLAATLLTIQSSVGIGGPFLFGWVADRLGGARALILIVFDAAVLWALLLMHPPFVVTAVIIGLIGLHGAGAPPVLSVALSEGFGQESFSRALGMANLLNLPFSVLCVPAAALVYARTGSYAGAIVGEAGFLVLAGLLVMVAARMRSPAKRV